MEKPWSTGDLAETISRLVGSVIGTGRYRATWSKHVGLAVTEQAVAAEMLWTL